MIEGRGLDGALPSECSADELRIWAELVQAHAAVARGLDDDLRAAHGLPLGEFQILLWLTHDPCASIRMTVLADTVHLSPSGLSRAIERLEARGLVARQQRADDRRGVDAVLTEAGAVLMRDASETHAAALQRRFFAHLTLEERHAIGPIPRRVLAANGQSCGWGGCPSTGTTP